MTTAMVRVLLVRHGESTWNRVGRWQGHADPPLSPTGRRQARAAAASVTPVDAIWSSDLARARETAELVAGQRALVRVEPRLRERDVGAWAGLTRVEIEDQYPGFLADGRRPERWEGDVNVARRAMSALHDIAASTPTGTALVVTHGGLIRAVELHLGASPHPIPNLGGVWLHRGPGGFALGARVSLRVDADVVEPGSVAAE